MKSLKGLELVLMDSPTRSVKGQCVFIEVAGNCLEIDNQPTSLLHELAKGLGGKIVYKQGTWTFTVKSVSRIISCEKCKKDITKGNFNSVYHQILCIECADKAALKRLRIGNSLSK